MSTKAEKEDVLALLGKPAAPTEDSLAMLAAYVRLYDERGGGVYREQTIKRIT